MIDFGYVNYNNLEDEHPDLVPTINDTEQEFMDLETLFHSMSQEQLELVICFYLGLEPLEIVKVLHYANIVKFYNSNAKLHDFYKKQKPKFMAVEN